MKTLIEKGTELCNTCVGHKVVRVSDDSMATKECPDCRTDDFSSRVCELGTKSCTIQHVGQPETQEQFLSHYVERIR